MENNEQKSKEELEQQKANTSENTSGEHKDHKKGGIHNNALYAASMGSSAVSNVDPHDNSGLAQTGTNLSYEGPTAPGGGGSVGNGYASGQDATGANTIKRADYDDGGNTGKRKEEENDEEDDAGR